MLLDLVLGEGMDVLDVDVVLPVARIELQLDGLGLDLQATLAQDFVHCVSR